MRANALPRFGAALVLALLFSLPWGGPPAAAGMFNPETFTLSNGMQVVVVPNHRVPVVTHMVWYKVGAAHEPPGRSGIAHFLEHLMFKGTETRAPGEFSAIVARNGGRENAFTSHDYTGYHQTVAKDRLDLVMGLEADRMTNLVIGADAVEPERLVVLEERRQRADNDPAAILREHINAALYLNHPYGRPVIGWEHEIRDLALDDILAFYRRWYAPNNAILVIAGDVTADEVRPLAEKHYGVIPAAAPVAYPVLREPPQRAARRVVLRDERVRQPSWVRTYLAPSATTGLADGGTADQAVALQVLARVLGSDTGRLHRALVVEGKVAVSAGAYYDPDRAGPSQFTVYAVPRDGVSEHGLEDAVERVIAHVEDTGVTAEEAERAKRRLRAEAVYARDSLRRGARVLGEALAIGRTVEDVEGWPDRVAAVTVADVQAALDAVMTETRSVTALLLPEDAGESR